MSGTSIYSNSTASLEYSRSLWATSGIPFRSRLSFGSDTCERFPICANWQSQERLQKVLLARNVLKLLVKWKICANSRSRTIPQESIRDSHIFRHLGKLNEESLLALLSSCRNVEELIVHGSSPAGTTRFLWTALKSISHVQKVEVTVWTSDLSAHSLDFTPFRSNTFTEYRGIHWSEQNDWLAQIVGFSHWPMWVLLIWYLHLIILRRGPDSTADKD